MEQESEQELQGRTDGGGWSSKLVMTEDELREVSRSVSKIVSDVRPNNDGDLSFNEVQQLVGDVLRAATSTNLSISHGAAAIGALCGLLHKCSISPRKNLKKHVLDPGIWTEAVNIYLTRSQFHKPKPLRRLLVTITLMLIQQEDDLIRQTLMEKAISTCLRAVYDEENSVSVKPAIQLLEHFLNQRLITAPSIIILAPSQFSQSRTKAAPEKSLSASQIKHEAKNLVLGILEWIQYPDCAPAIAGFLPVFLASIKKHVANKLRSGEFNEETPFWIDAVKDFLEDHPNLHEPIENYVLPNLLRLDTTVAQAFLLPFSSPQNKCLVSYSESELQLCLLTLRISSKIGFCGDSQPESSRREMVGSININYESLAIDLLDHESCRVRISALNTIIAGILDCKTMGQRTLIRLKECIPFFHQETSPKPRNEFIALMKKLCGRLIQSRLASLPNITKSSEKSSDNAAEAKITALELSTKFMPWYIRFLVQELRPTTPYQGHATALNILCALCEMRSDFLELAKTQKPDQNNAARTYGLHQQLSRALLDLLFNPFDDVRQISAAILENLVMSEFLQRNITNKEASQKCSNLDLTSRSITHEILSGIIRAKALFKKTGRADHADGLGRLLSLAFGARRFSSANYDQCSAYKLIEYELEQGLCIAAGNLERAVNTSPLHGYLIALRYINSRSDISDSSKYLSSLAFSQKIPHLCKQIWAFVKPVLCADAPEGQVLYDDPVDDTDMGGKERLSFCWRALKESSLLMHTTISRYSSTPCFWEEDSYAKIHCQLGKLTFQQLAELRHRGAFSTVSQTFAAWCVSCTNSGSEEIAKLPRKFYYETLACIQQRSTALTRRSAGLPTMVTGILSAYPGSHFFDDVLLDLQAIADAPIEGSMKTDALQLPQVHAINCLKEIFTDSRFGPGTEPHIANSLDLAAQCLDSPMWAIRNCGLMLMKALLNRVNGGTDTSSSRASRAHRRFSRLIYKRFPNLPDIVLGLLSSQARNPDDGQGCIVHAQRVFPGLEIVERFGLPDLHAKEIKQAIIRHLEGPVWSLREKAAKALSSIVQKSDIGNVAQRLLRKDLQPQNALHGRLLCLRILLGRLDCTLFTKIDETARLILLLLDDSFDDMVQVNKCPFTAGAFLDIISDVFNYWAGSSCKRNGRACSQVTYGVMKHIASKRAISLKHIALMAAIMTSPEVSLYLRAVERCKTSFGIFMSGSMKADHLHQSLAKLAEFPQDSEQFELELCERGCRLGTEYAKCQENEKVLVHLVMWVRSLMLVTGETLIKSTPYPDGLRHMPHDVTARRAAVLSIRKFFETLSDKKVAQNGNLNLLPVYLALYDTIVDDDEDVRVAGAQVLSTFLPISDCKGRRSSGRLLISPPAAKRRLLRFLETTYLNASSFYAEVILRIAGLLPAAYVHHRPVFSNNERQESSEYLGQSFYNEAVELDINIATQRQDTIFVEEKQNLYIDPVREVDSWMEVIWRLEPSEGPQKKSLEDIDHLGRVVFEGASQVTEFLKRILRIDGDGTLGIASRPEGFTIFHRCISIAGLCRYSLKKGTFKRWMDRSTYSFQHISPDHLLDLKITGESAHLHGLLLAKLDEVIG